MRFPANLRYTNDHTWLRKDDGHAYVGITDFAQYELGDITCVHVFQNDGLLLKGEVFGSMESVRTNWELHMPVTGIVLEINPLLRLDPALINRDCYGEGWIAKLKVMHGEEVMEMMHAIDYMGGW